jgi:FKBP-type peptidyl-prolyl cis-trans isomerase (trigger factor)
MIFKSDAILSLRPNAEFVVRGETVEWHDTNQTQPTEEEIQAEITRLQAEYDANQYQRDRATQYKPVTDQLDMLWHAIDTGTLDKTCDFYTVNKTVKDNNPKE